MKNVLKAFGTLLLLVLFVTAISEISPVFDFADPKPFSGPDIFNPYRNLDTSIAFKRANFHTHTWVPGPLKECNYTAEEAIGKYHDFGYEVVTISNHNNMLYDKVYEHGYNLFKYHKLVFGAPYVIHFDNMLPLLPSQRQFQLDILGKSADLVQLNHPARTNMTGKDDMEKLSGYRTTELDCDRSAEFWDMALSAGHYSYAVCNDDLHHLEYSHNFAIRCSFLNCKDNSYDSVLHTLKDGSFYCMRVMDYGNGDWQEKLEKNKNVPAVRNIGLRGDTLFIDLSTCANYITVTGQNHSCLDSLANTSHLEYLLPKDEPYARFSALFYDGSSLYTNPFAHYDKTKAESPFENSPHSVNVGLTILFNLALLLLAAACIWLIVRLWSHKKLKS